MTIEEKIKLYVEKNGEVLGCDLPNKVFRQGLKKIKINSCAQVQARKMVREGRLNKDYVNLNDEGPRLVVYSL